MQEIVIGKTYRYKGVNQAGNGNMIILKEGGLVKVVDMGKDWVIVEIGDDEMGIFPKSYFNDPTKGKGFYMVD